MNLAYIFLLRGLFLLLASTGAIGAHQFGDAQLILTLGATGSGKSTFCNLASGSNLEIGGGLRSCTSAVQFSRTFLVNGRPTVLIDTPGFDDSSLSDAEILTAINEFLSGVYEEGRLLTGILYFHRISDYRMGGIARKNFDMFHKMCGNSTLKNVAIITNMWNSVPLDIGEAREQELKTEKDFFGPVLAEGAVLFRHDNTTESAYAILRHVLSNVPLPLEIQRETVDQCLVLKDTSAGHVLYQEHEEQMRIHAEELRRAEELRQNENSVHVAEREKLARDLANANILLHNHRQKRCRVSIGVEPFKLKIC